MDLTAQIIISVLSGLNILEIIGFFIYYRLNKKSKDLDNVSKDIDNNGKQNENFDKLLDSTNKVIQILEDKFNKSEVDSQQKKDEIEKLTKDNQQLVQEKIQLMEENGLIKIRCSHADFLKCTCLECDKRRPPLYSADKFEEEHNDNEK